MIEVDRLFNPNTQLSSIHRSRGKPAGWGLATICLFPLTAETYRTDVSGEVGIARQCPPVGDSKGDEERCDDLFEETIR